MKKRLLSLAIAIAIALPMTLAVNAQDTAPPESGGASSQTSMASDANELGITVSDGVIGFTSNTPSEVSTAAKDEESTLPPNGIYPFEVRYESHNGLPVIVKSYKVPSGFDPSVLIEDGFEDGKYSYDYKYILKNEPTMINETKLVAQTVTFTSEDKEQNTVMAALSPIMEYNEGGFSGQLELDYNSILTVEAGKTNYSYPISKTVEYTNLDRNDYSYLDKEVNGLTLNKVDWTPMGSSQRGDVMVPTSYNASAVYTGVGYGTKVTGYNNTAIYKGTVTRSTEGDTVYSIIYQGEKVPLDLSQMALFLFIALITVAVLAAIVILVRKFFPNITIPSFKRKKASGTEDVPVSF